ncbi:MAG TPA: phosphoadenylyl-sulfate reductase [Acidobacteriaceae bacterium]|jgi:phosphoadenosine phosphosulfate reductase|nr:phosphoadenylyl-sulfate reductase [Acidobacteriaceae bacterium]
MSRTETVTNYEELTAGELIAQVVREAAGAPLCLTSSFQTEDMVVLHMLRRHLPNIPVIFLETGYHFKELLAYRDRMTAEWGLNLINALPLTTLAEHEAQFGLLHIVQPTQCCAIRKVEPLMRHLEPFDWWFTGLRREQSPTRAGLKKVEDHKTPTGKRMKKVSVLADWTMAQVDAYAETHAIPKLELYARGYTSIGCEPCTAIPDDPANPRAGRWGGKKLECGIHTFSDKM